MTRGVFGDLEMDTRPGKHIKNDGKSEFLMGKPVFTPKGLSTAIGYSNIPF
jgi:hypothetical protein